MKTVYRSLFFAVYRFLLLAESERKQILAEMAADKGQADEMPDERTARLLTAKIIATIFDSTEPKPETKTR